MDRTADIVYELEQGFVETEGEDSGLFKKYRLNRGFTNYLLDGNGVIIAKNISAADLSAYVKEVG